MNSSCVQQTRNLLLTGFPQGRLTSSQHQVCSHQDTVQVVTPTSVRPSTSASREAQHSQRIATLSAHRLDRVKGPGYPVWLGKVPDNSDHLLARCWSGLCQQNDPKKNTATSAGSFWVSRSSSRSL